MSLLDAIDKAKQEWSANHGNCAMCSAGDEPADGLHRGEYPCGNNNACSLCNDAGMKHGDQCAACGRIEKRAI